MWWSTEVFVLQNLGFGTYAFQTESRLDELDANATFGGFTWDPWGDEEGVPDAVHREIDFEDSRWGVPEEPLNTQMVVQPYGVGDNRHRYILPDLSADAALTRFFTWRADRIDFTALRGHHSAFSFPPASVIETFPYLHDPGVLHFVPSEGRERFRFNLWLNNGPPTGGQPIEVVITDFSYTPLAPPVPSTSTGHVAVLVSLLGVTTLCLLGNRHRRDSR